jgi:hypothetical protein
VNLPAIEWCDTGDSARGAVRRCVLENTDVIPALSSPVKIHPYVPETPWVPFEFPDGCVARSDYPIWQVDDLVYNHKTSAPSLSFNLTNLSNGGRIACSIEVNTTLTRSTAHSEHWQTCSTENGPNLSPPDVSGTQILFDPDYELLAIKQTWMCHEDGRDIE